MASAASTHAIPNFYLYGEPHRRVNERFVHLESLDDRSRPSEWTIRPHAHAELNHVFQIRKGGGALRAEAAVLPFEAACLIVVPAGMVHGFAWQSESQGSVLTISNAYLDHLVRSDTTLRPLFGVAAMAPLTPIEDAGFAAATERLQQELGWRATGHRAATEGHLLDLLVRTLRALEPQLAAPDHHRGVQAVLVARFRQRVEERFHRREAIAIHADALGTSESRLRAACSVVARQSPMQILDARALLEAQRALLYTNLTVAEIALTVGFEDAAYFSRFFRRHIGKSPRGFRDRAA